VDVILKRELAKSEQQLITPATEVAGVDVEDDQDEATNVVDGHRLGVQVKEGSGLLKEHGRVQIHLHSEGARASGGWRGEGSRGGRPLLDSKRPGGIQGLGGGRRLGDARHRGVVGGLALCGEALRLGCGSLGRGGGRGILVRAQL